MALDNISTTTTQKTVTNTTDYSHNSTVSITYPEGIDTGQFDPSKITNVSKTEEIENREGTYRPVQENGLSGTGILDILLETIRLNLDAQRQSGRIRQEEYAQAYIALTQAAIQAAVQLILQGDLAAKEAAIKDAMLAKEAEQIATYQRQRIAYDEDFLVKASQHLLDGYIAFLTSMPNVENQLYPIMFTSDQNVKFNDNDEKVSGKNVKLRYMDGVMSRLYARIKHYQPEQTDV